MSSIRTNRAAMQALTTLRDTQTGLGRTQERVATGLKIRSGKDNAAYFSLSETLKGDSGMNRAIAEGLTLTRNAVSVARLATQSVLEMTDQIGNKLMLAQAQYDLNRAFDGSKIQGEIDAILQRVRTTIASATFNGASYVDGHVNQHQTHTDALETGVLSDTTAPRNSFRDYDLRADLDRSDYDPANDPDVVQVVVGVSRSGDAFGANAIGIKKADLVSIEEALSQIDVTRDYQPGYVVIRDQFDAWAPGDNRILFYSKVIDLARGMLTDDAVRLGQAEKAVEQQQLALSALSDLQDVGVGRLIDADMEEEAARLQALQVQEQLATQALSIANQAPSNVLALFR